MLFSLAHLPHALFSGIFFFFLSFLCCLFGALGMSLRPCGRQASALSLTYVLAFTSACAWWVDMPSTCATAHVWGSTALFTLLRHTFACFCHPTFCELPGDSPVSDLAEGCWECICVPPPSAFSLCGPWGWTLSHEAGTAGPVSLSHLTAPALTRVS